MSTPLLLIFYCTNNCTNKISYSISVLVEQIWNILEVNGDTFLTLFSVLKPQFQTHGFHGESQRFGIRGKNRLGKKNVVHREQVKKTVKAEPKPPY